MSLNPAGMGASYNWNYSRPEAEGYSLEITGTIVSMQEVQAREYSQNRSRPGRPAFWDDGNPKMNIRIGLACPDMNFRSITFAKAGRRQVSGEKPSLHMQLFNLTDGSMDDLMGKTVHIWTWPSHPTTGQPWGNGNPRLYGVELVEGTYALSGPIPKEFTVPQLYANDAASGGQPVYQQQQQPPQVQVPQQIPPMQGGYHPYPQQPMMPQQPQYNMQQQYNAPQPQYNMQQPMMQQQPQYNMQQQQPQQPQQPAAIPVQQQPQQMTMPDGMDPAVAAAMQAVGATNVQEIPQDAYEDEVPF